MQFIDKINFYLDKQSKSQLDKGRRIASFKAVKIKEGDDKESYELQVPSESSRYNYTVDIYDIESSPDLGIMCECPAFFDHEDCKHCVAAAITIRRRLSSDVTEIPIIATPEVKEGKQIKLDQDGYFHFTMDSISGYTLQRLAGNPSQSAINKILNNLKPGPLNMPHQCFSYYEKSKKVCDVDIVFDRNNGFKTRCTCSDKTYPLCKHVFGGFAYLEYHYNRFYFNRFKLFTDEKNKILANYGLSLNDPEAKDFEWQVSPWGELTLIKKPAYLISAGNIVFLQGIKQSILGNATTRYNMLRLQLPASTMLDFEIGFLFNFTSARHIGFELETVFVREKNGKQDLKKLVLHNQSNLPFLQSLSDDIFYQLLEFSDQKLVEWMAQKGNSYLNSYANPWNQISEPDREQLKKHYLELLQNLWPVLCEEPFVYQLNEGRFSNANIQPVKLSKTPVQLFFTVDADERFITIKIDFILEGVDLLANQAKVLKSGLILEADNTLYLLQNPEDLLLAQNFAGGLLKFPIADQLEIIRNIILPLQAKYSVMVSNSLNFDVTGPEPQPQLLLSEFEDKFLMLKPRFLYGETLIDYDDNQEHIQQSEGAIKILKRNKPEEKKLYEYLRTLHPKFASQRNNLYYFLPFAEVMKGNWFLNMIQQVQEAGFPVFGLQDLKTFRYNTHTPTFDIEAGSGIDWFDLKIEIHWGEQQVPLAAIRKAILNKQEAVLLDDGTLGIIPAEWLEQYGLLLKVGNEKEGKVRVSKLHYNLLDELGDKLNNQDVQLEIAEKKRKLVNFSEMQTHQPPSAAINAQLRPYQLAGFQWLQALDELGWGGCLADDMGLGKTLQAITFLQFLKEKKPGGTQLVVCPTSLIFNWENELDKFGPDLKYHTYYGNMRSFDDDHFEKFDVILTTYGVVRLDVEHLSRFSWHYIILDESQAIKNPDAQVTKSLQLLKAENKLILSGTPVQNNTYDLFAQFNFINPGFLGQREFFKQEFANPIDKFGDKLKSEQLRRMVYPFMLRRTKEQVATDLPDKTETILWCSMNKGQRSIYDEYKNYYRNMLLKKIEEEGMGKSGIYVLEGLLRLRQICDHPALIKEAGEATAESVKTEELMREIQENSGGHKLLVFSQFTEMLQLISKELKKADIPFCYLDGKTAAASRKAEVTRFQEDENIKVFLISLKAGGVGLNLTAADYVYLVDPWWNPAAEQQAIDRTHRIGQTRKIFAYKMICKDTVEEKILQLQQKKKNLADELINEESGFVKKLTKDDIAFLFS
ncbi:DEAD/DEAH box helicase [Mucilaginibacter arboris]|uniref:ATP-dependent helicase n=1 Tax=Mucilaginibacter arboris TaxID=2682090 RepID=A0A7K1SWF1_9SPHI|nr:DEAD/DEAH box helicase [Mucilaginibacter arboris]MVN21568.1 ATP-dependent helicase [Mucilaginibacter arboris]